MSRNYDNWERLVAAVLKREEIWQICHASSRSTSFSSISSPSDFSTPITSTSQFDENSKSAKSAIEIEDEWVEQYEPGVYVTIADLSDGTRELQRVRFSQSKFKYQGAEETWWRENRKKVYEKYTAQEEYGRVTQSSISSQGTSVQNEQHLKESEVLVPIWDNNNSKPRNSQVQGTASGIEHDWIEPGGYITFAAVSDGTRQSISSGFISPSSSSKFDENIKYSPKSGVRECDGIQIEDEWVEQYEAGVYISLGASREGSREIKHVRFSRKKFKEMEAETWWVDNREKVYEKYNAQFRQPSVSGQANKFDDKKDETPLMGTRSIFDENVKPTNSGVEITEREFVNEWIENYEPGVNVTLRAFRDGTTNVIRVHFSERFKVQQADDWWLKNRKKVCEKYNARAGLARIKESSSISG